MRTAVRKMELGLVAPRAASAHTLAADATKGFVTFLRRIGNRFKANQLLEMDDHQLFDIGLTRSDVRDALNAGIADDPTTRLAKIAKMAAARAL